MAGALIACLLSAAAAASEPLLYDDRDLDRAMAAYALPIGGTWAATPDLGVDVLGGFDEVANAGTRSQYTGLLIDVSIVPNPSAMDLMPHERETSTAEERILRVPPAMQLEPSVLGLRDRSGLLPGGDGFSALRLPLPGPAGLSWGVSAYDPHTRSTLDDRTLGALYPDLKPAPPADREGQWINSIPGGGLILYFSVHHGS